MNRRSLLKTVLFGFGVFMFWRPRESEQSDISPTNTDDIDYLQPGLIVRLQRGETIEPW